MKINVLTAISLLLIIILLIPGCTKTSTSTATTPATTSQLTTTQVTTAQSTTVQSTTTQPTTVQPTTTQQQAQPCSRETIEGNVLYDFLPALGQEWDVGESAWGYQDTGMGCDYYYTYVNAVNGDDTIYITIYDTNYWSGINWVPVAGGSWQAEDGAPVTLNGYPGYEHVTDGPELQYLVDLGNGIVVWGRLYPSTDTELLAPYMNAIDYAGLAALA